MPRGPAFPPAPFRFEPGCVAGIPSQHELGVAQAASGVDVQERLAYEKYNTNRKSDCSQNNAALCDAYGTQGEKHNR